MSNDIRAFGSIENALREFLYTRYQPLVDMTDASARRAAVGGSLAYDPETQPFYIRIDRLPGNMTRFEGDFPIEVEVFASQYRIAESHALAIEALMLGYPHRVEVDGSLWVFDRVFQNVGIDELPWEDDETSRLGSTFVITARRR